jgi:hypothetical protein
VKGEDAGSHGEMPGRQSSVLDRGLSLNPASFVLYTPPGTHERPIRRLKVKHRRMISLFMQGYSYKQIAMQLGCRPETVGAVIRNPAARAILDRAYAEHEQTLKALVPLTTGVLRRGLLDPDVEVGLKATDQLYKMLGKYKAAETSGASAEDVIRRIITMRNGDQEVTIAEERR